VKVRRARFGPGLWPGPRRQARWVRRDSGAQGRVARIVSCQGMLSAAHDFASSRDTTAEIAFLTRALKAPTLRESVPRLAERARAES
jgi:hypothetical protein